MPVTETAYTYRQERRRLIADERVFRKYGVSSPELNKQLTDVSTNLREAQDCEARRAIQNAAHDGTSPETLMSTLRDIMRMT